VQKAVFDNVYYTTKQFASESQYFLSSDPSMSRVVALCFCRIAEHYSYKTNWNVCGTSVEHLIMSRISCLDGRMVDGYRRHRIPMLQVRIL